VFGSQNGLSAGHKPQAPPNASPKAPPNRFMKEYMVTTSIPYAGLVQTGWDPIIFSHPGIVEREWERERGRWKNSKKSKLKSKINFIKNKAKVVYIYKHSYKR
jgi:heme A synthase